MELPRPAAPEGYDWLSTLCGQRLSMSGGHLHTAEETAPVGSFRLGRRDQVRGVLCGEVLLCWGGAPISPAWCDCHQM